MWSIAQALQENLKSFKRFLYCVCERTCVHAFVCVCVCVCRLVKDLSPLSVTVHWAADSDRQMIGYWQVSVWLTARFFSKGSFPLYNSSTVSFLPHWGPFHLHPWSTVLLSLLLSITRHLMNGWQPFNLNPSDRNRPQCQCELCRCSKMNLHLLRLFKWHLLMPPPTMRMHSCICMCIHKRFCACTHTHTRAHTHTHTHTHTNTNAHTFSEVSCTKHLCLVLFVYLDSERGVFQISSMKQYQLFRFYSKLNSLSVWKLFSVKFLCLGVASLQS